MLADGHGREKIIVKPLLMMRYTGQLEDVEVPAPVKIISGASDMRALLAHFEEVYTTINHRVSRYGTVGVSITELGLTATADKVKPTLEKLPLGTSDPSAAHKGVREAYLLGRWRNSDLYEMDKLKPGHEIKGPAIIEHPATTLVIHPRDEIFVDEWNLLHYRHGRHDAE
jgi:N-methylhydantoinase A